MFPRTKPGLARGMGFLCRRIFSNKRQSSCSIFLKKIREERVYQQQIKTIASMFPCLDEHAEWKCDPVEVLG
jgi:hypothetical protein